MYNIYILYVYVLFNLFTGLGGVHARPLARGLEGEGVEVGGDVAPAAWFMCVCERTGE